MERESRTTKPGSPPATSAEATSETSAWKARLAPKWATASAGDAGATRSTGFVLVAALVTVVSTVTVMVLPSSRPRLTGTFAAPAPRDLLARNLRPVILFLKWGSTASLLIGRGFPAIHRS